MQLHIWRPLRARSDSHWRSICGWKLPRKLPRKHLGRKTFSFLCVHMYALRQRCASTHAKVKAAKTNRTIEPASCVGRGLSYVCRLPLNYPLFSPLLLPPSFPPSLRPFSFRNFSSRLPRACVPFTSFSLSRLCHSSFSPLSSSPDLPFFRVVLLPCRQQTIPIELDAQQRIPNRPIYTNPQRPTLSMAQSNQRYTSTALTFHTKTDNLYSFLVSD